jgi:hypothetical protein
MAMVFEGKCIEKFTLQVSLFQRIEFFGAKINYPHNSVKLPRILYGLGDLPADSHPGPGNKNKIYLYLFLLIKTSAALSPYFICDYLLSRTGTQKSFN